MGKSGIMAFSMSDCLQRQNVPDNMMLLLCVYVAGVFQDFQLRTKATNYYAELV